MYVLLISKRNAFTINFIFVIFSYNNCNNESMG